MDIDLVRRHRTVNRLQSVFLLLSMAALLIVVGWLFDGAFGVALALLLAVAVAVASPGISPRFILSVYRARELPPGQAAGLHRLVAELARRAGLRRRPRLFHVASPVLNAFALGHRGESYIVISDGLLRSLTPRELAGVLAHEISHVRHNDTTVMALADLFSRLTGVLSTAGQILLFLNLPLVMFSDYRINWWAILVLIAAPLASTLIQLALSRAREYDADVGAVELTGDPDGLASALHKIERRQHGVFERVMRRNQGDPEPSMLRTHPHTRDRLERLRSLQPRRTVTAPWEPDMAELVIPPVRRHRPRWRSGY